MPDRRQLLSSVPARYGKVTEITEEKVIGKGIDSFTIELPQHVTAIFMLEERENH